MPRKHKRPVRKQPPALLIGIALLVIAVFALKSGSNAGIRAPHYFIKWELLLSLFMAFLVFDGAIV